MSQVEHRARLNAAAPVSARPAAKAPAASVPDGVVAPTEAEGASGPTGSPEPAPPVVAEPMAAEPAVIVPEASPPTPAERRLQGRKLAEELSAMSQEDYATNLAALQASNPVLYGVVVDELNNMAAAAAEAAQTPNP